jgi:hypothetical protein
VRIGNTYPARDPADGVVAWANELCVRLPAVDSSSGNLPSGPLRLVCARPITARYASMQIVGRTEYLLLCEIEFHV